MTSFLRADGDDVLVSVWVVPGASTTAIVGVHGDRLKVRVAAPPERGKANRLVGRVLAGATGARRAELEKGAGSRAKVFRLHHVTLEQARAAFEGAGG